MKSVLSYHYRFFYSDGTPRRSKIQNRLRNPFGRMSPHRSQRILQSPRRRETTPTNRILQSRVSPFIPRSELSVQSPRRRQTTPTNRILQSPYRRQNPFIPRSQLNVQSPRRRQTTPTYRILQSRVSPYRRQNPFISRNQRSVQSPRRRESYRCRKSPSPRRRRRESPSNRHRGSPSPLLSNWNPFERNSTSPLLRDRSPFLRDRSPLLRDRSPFLRDRSPLLRDRSPFLRDRSPFERDLSPLLRDRSPFLRDRSPLLRDRSPFERDSSPLELDRNPFRSGRNTSRRNSSARRRSLSFNRRERSLSLTGSTPPRRYRQQSNFPLQRRRIIIRRHPHKGQLAAYRRKIAKLRILRRSASNALLQSLNGEIRTLVKLSRATQGLPLNRHNRYRRKITRLREVPCNQQSESEDENILNQPDVIEFLD